MRIQSIEYCPLTGKWWCMRCNQSLGSSSVLSSMMPVCVCSSSVLSSIDDSVCLYHHILKYRNTAKTNTDLGIHTFSANMFTHQLCSTGPIDNCMIWSWKYLLQIIASNKIVYVLQWYEEQNSRSSIIKQNCLKSRLILCTSVSFSENFYDLNLYDFGWRTCVILSRGFVAGQTDVSHPCLQVASAQLRWWHMEDTLRRKHKSARTQEHKIQF